ncbi:MAG: hypothetical protein EOP47_26125 [Sphingobacteriaceae bacterium]|nr:MAG: hypothetical protein EOP47_26125 [Sphingobacteriaceae bacterium]
MIYGIIYIILFLFQFTHNSVVYFGYREFKEDRGVIRVIFPGAGVFFLSCYMAVNKVTSVKCKYKYLWLAFALIGVIINIMQVTRQAIVVMLLMYLVHFLRNVKLPYKIATIAVFVLAGYIFINSRNTISTGLAEQQKTDASAGPDYIRVLSAKHFLTEFSPNMLSRILGNGFYNLDSNYGRHIKYLEENYGYYLTDVGVIEVYIAFGVFALLGYILIFVKSFTIPLPPEYQYLKYYLWMVMLTSFTSDSLISTGFLITTVLVLYCYQRFYEKRKFDLFYLKLATGSK